MGDNKNLDEILLNFIYKRDFFNKLVSFKGLEINLENDFYSLNDLEVNDFKNLNSNGLFKNLEAFEYKSGLINKEILPNSIFYIEDGLIKFIQHYEEKENNSFLITETYLNNDFETNIVYEKVPIYNESHESYPNLTAENHIFYDVLLEKLDAIKSDDDEIFEEYLEEDFEKNDDSDDTDDPLGFLDHEDESPCDHCEFNDWDENENLGLNESLNNESNFLKLYVRSSQKFVKKVNDYLTLNLEYESNGNIKLELKNDLGLELSKHFSTQSNLELSFKSKIDEKNLGLLANAFNNGDYISFIQTCSQIFNKNENATMISYNNQREKYKTKKIEIQKGLNMMLY